jgi:chromosomal replication initiation ATPase DnaA
MSKAKFDPRAPHIMSVIERVAREYHVPVSEILGRARTILIMRARRAAIRQVKKELPALSSTQIGRIFNRDHTTILYALGQSAYGRQMGHGK